MSIEIQIDPYMFDPHFERAVVTLCVRKGRFWSRIGHALDSRAVGLPESKLILETCGLVQRETGRAPESPLLLIQRLRRMMVDGKITLDQVSKAADLFDQAEDFGLPDEDAVINELVPILKRRMQSSAIMNAHDEFARKGNFEAVVTSLNRANRLGEADTSIGTIMGAEAFSEIETMSSITRLPTGVMDVDLQLVDGLQRTGLGVVLGGSGDGKSMFLMHQGAHASKDPALKLFVGMATLELPKAVQIARYNANLTGIPVNQIMENATDRAEAKRRAQIMAASGQVGPCIIEEFPPHATTVQDLADWADRIADQFGRPLDLMVVDYGDKLHHPTKNDNEYLAMRHVFEGLRRDIAVKRNMWVWTGAQASRPTKETGKRLDLHHVSDSMHKVRVADLVLTLNVRDEGSQMLFYIAKNRLGRSRFQVGPVPTDFERARIVPASAEFADWSVV